MMEFLSKRIAGKLSNEPESKELYQYAIYIILSSLLHLVTLVIIGAFLGLVYESILMYFSFAVIRRFAGGYAEELDGVRSDCGTVTIDNTVSYLLIVRTIVLIRLIQRGIGCFLSVLRLVHLSYLVHM